MCIKKKHSLTRDQFNDSANHKFVHLVAQSFSGHHRQRHVVSAVTWTWGFGLGQPNLAQLHLSRLSYTTYKM